jgi:hypothetical protein
VSADDEKAVDWYSFTTGYEAGAASRGAEVAALEKRIEQLGWRLDADIQMMNIAGIGFADVEKALKPVIREAKAEALEEGWDAAVSASRYSYENTNWWVNPYRSGTTTEGTDN